MRVFQLIADLISGFWVDFFPPGGRGLTDLSRANSTGVRIVTIAIDR